MSNNFTSCRICGSEENFDKNLKFKINGNNEVGPYCESCWNKIKLCEHCQKPGIIFKDIRKIRGTGEYLCKSCRLIAKDLVQKTCSRCGEVKAFTVTDDSDDSILCESCIRDTHFKCPKCNKWHVKANNIWNDSTNIIKHLK